MKRVYVNEKWCLGCHLCEYYCAYADISQSEAEKLGDSAEREKPRETTRVKSMANALKGVKINPRINIEDGGGTFFAVSCRHCSEPLCVKGCISGALSVDEGTITVDKEKCVSCYTCILSCPYGAISVSANGPVQKCELCHGEPACVQGCPNNAIVFEERGEGA